MEPRGVLRARSMRDPGCGLRGTTLPRTPVNRSKRRASPFQGTLGVQTWATGAPKHAPVLAEASRSSVPAATAIPAAAVHGPRVGVGGPLTPRRVRPAAPEPKCCHARRRTTSGSPGRRWLQPYLRATVAQDSMKRQRGYPFRFLVCTCWCTTGVNEPREARSNSGLQTILSHTLTMSDGFG